MEYLINSIAEIRNKQADESKVLYSGNRMTVQCFRVRKGSSVMEDNDDPSYEGVENRTICYIVERGSAEYWLGEEKVVVPSGGCITITPKENFSMWALEDCFIIAIYNHEEPDIDNSPVELVEAVKKVELRDRYLQGHNYRVGKYSMLMMQIICPNKANYQYYFSAAYHDVGKVVVPEEVLNKPGNLTEMGNMI